MRGPKETIAMANSDHNNLSTHQQGGWYIRPRQALESLRKTGDFRVHTRWARP